MSAPLADPAVVGSVGGGDRATSVLARVTLPVQQTNIIGFLATHLPSEHALIVGRIAELKEQLHAAQQYRETLERVAVASDVTLTQQLQNPLDDMET